MKPWPSAWEPGRNRQLIAAATAVTGVAFILGAFYACTRPDTSRTEPQSPLANGKSLHLSPSATGWTTSSLAETVEESLDGKWQLLSETPDEKGRLFFEARLEHSLLAIDPEPRVELIREGKATPVQTVSEDWDALPGTIAVREEVFHESPFRFALRSAGQRKIEALLRPGRVDITVNARAKIALGIGPEMVLHFNGEQIARFEVQAATYEPHRARSVADKGSNQLTIEFTNDYWDPPEDRNLYIESVEFHQPATIVVCLAASWKDRKPPPGLVARYRSPGPLASAYGELEPARGLGAGTHGWFYYQLGTETRPAIPLAPPGTVDFVVSVDQPAVLRMGLGAALARGETRPATVEFSVSCSDIDGRELRSASHVLVATADADTAHWRDVSLDLPPMSEGRVRVSSALRGIDSPASASPPLCTALVSEPLVQAAEIAEEKTMGIILISLDTLRADHLSCYGYERETSPNLDAFAEKYVHFLHPIAQSNWTLPSHISMLSSLYVSTHGVESKWTSVRRLRTVAEVLRDHGFRTKALVDGGFLSPEFGLTHGFDSYENHDYGGFAAILPAAEKWLRQNGHRSFFLFLHTYDTHGPYAPPPPFFDHFPLPETGISEELREGVPGEYLAVRDRPEKIEDNPVSETDLIQIVNLYDSGIVHMDHLLGPFLEFLGQRPFWNNLLVVITSDHGEAMMEHGALCHGATFYEELVRVPLLVRLPEVDNPAKVEQVVELVDLAPTILDWAAADVPREMQGRSLMPILVGSEIAEQPAHAEGKGLLAYRDQRLKFIWGGGNAPELYDLVMDPREKVNLASRRPELVERLTEDVKAFRQRNRESLDRKVSQEMEPSESVMEKLRGIGYVGD